MIVIRWKDELASPFVLCDLCGQEIETARDGNYLWHAMDEEGKQLRDKAEIFFTHKKCNREFENRHGGTAGTRFMSGELRYFAPYLVHNLKQDFANDDQEEKFFSHFDLDV